ncbi:response regulator [Paenibacillus sp. GD4]|jgi:two-component system, response regulator YesN|uniref:response regulator transcription factor n=1 Tax=Paenibacillus sp. GD4 TaxID=3068890 RepID=UPI002796C1DF|nr:response regulator [Paenibacillus sp. GD4]MDQ1912764.1 response regulator [Paenibacillus sp. GD4]
MYKVLLVDDERWVRTSLRKTMERMELPFEVVQESANGLEARDWLERNEVDLVMTDIRMPVMDGLQLVRFVHELERPPEVVIVSGHDEFSYAQQAMKYGVSEYMLKPVTEEDLETCLTGLRKKLLKKQAALESQGDGDAVDTREMSTIEQVIHFVKSRLPGEVSLQEAAGAVFLNPSYLSQLFKQEMKVNFVDYVLTLRMEEARRLLRTTSLRISDIAERVGYADISYFSNTFKRLLGETPSEFRKGEKKLN